MQLSTLLKPKKNTYQFPVQSFTKETLCHKEIKVEGFSRSLIEKLFPSWVIVEQDHYQNVRYLSANSVQLFGYLFEELKSKTFRDVKTYLHEEDRESFVRALQKIEELTKNIDSAQIQEYRFVMNYRLRRGDGKYMHIQEERIFMADHSGKYKCFLLLKDISTEKPFTRVHVEWFRYQNGAYLKMNSYVPTSAEQYFSQREIEVLQLIKEGFSSKEIADRLCISINTVRNHRSKLFRKANAKNMVELLNYAYAIQTDE